MTIPPKAGDRRSANPSEKTLDQRFVVLDCHLAVIAEISEHIARKHWHRAEREQYPFWIGILLIALSGIGGMLMRDVQWIGLAVALVMLIGLAILVAIYLRDLQGRFGRLWSEMAADGELFRVLRDTGVALGYPVDMGKPKEVFHTHLDAGFADSVHAVEKYLRTAALLDPALSGASPGFFVPAATLIQPAGGESHRVYEIEYRGSATLSLSIRVSMADRGTDIVIGFPLTPSGAETRERLASSLQGKLQNRFVAAKLLADLRAVAGAPPMPIPVVEEPPYTPEYKTSRAI